MKTPTPLHFAVTGHWMTTTGRGDSSKTFRVIRVEQDASLPEYDRIILDSNGTEWPVFRYRGRFVQPYGLIICNGHFEPFDTAKDEPAGSVRVCQMHAEFATVEEARLAANELNDALHLVVAADLKTQEIDYVTPGTTIRRLLRNGLPMLKEYTAGSQYDRGYYGITDSKGKTIYIKAGTLVAVD